MKKNVWKVKLFKNDTYFICQDLEDILYYTNLLIDKDLHADLTIGKLQNVFKYSDISFFDTETNKYRRFKLDTPKQVSKLKKKFRQNVKYTNCYIYPSIEWVEVSNWIDFTEDIFKVEFWNKIDVGEQYKRPYRKRIILSEINKQLGVLDITDNIFDLMETSSIISSVDNETERMDDFDNDSDIDIDAIQEIY